MNNIQFRNIIRNLIVEIDKPKNMWDVNRFYDPENPLTESELHRIEQMKEESSEWLSSKKPIFYRGVQDRAGNRIMKRLGYTDTDNDRESMNVTKIEAVLTELFRKAIKSNAVSRYKAVFATQSLEMAGQYGRQYIFIPTNGCDFCYNPKIDDFFFRISNFSQDELKDLTYDIYNNILTGANENLPEIKRKMLNNYKKAGVTKISVAKYLKGLVDYWKNMVCNKLNKTNNEYLFETKSYFLIEVELNKKLNIIK